MRRALATGTPGPALFRSLAGDMKKAIDSLLRPAQKLFPTLASFFSLSLTTETYRVRSAVPLADARRTPREDARLTAAANDLVQRFPLAVESYAAAGEMYLSLDSPDRAIAACTQGLAVRPRDPRCLNVRMTALAQAGRCAEARADVAAAQQNLEFTAPTPAFVMRCGRP